MATNILMPKLGLTMTEGEIVEMKIAPGDRVDVGDVLFVIETDKTSTDVEALDAGTIATVLASVGDTIEVGAVVATLAQD